MPCQESQLQAAKAGINGQRRAARVLGPLPPLLQLEGVGGSWPLLDNYKSEKGSGKCPDVETADLL